jgi:hypothetical protein
MSLHGEEGDDQDAVRELCAAADSFVYSSYHRQAEGRVVIPGIWRPFGRHTGRAGGRAALSIMPYMNRAEYCRQRNYYS